MIFKITDNLGMVTVIICHCQSLPFITREDMIYLLLPKFLAFLSLS